MKNLSTFDHKQRTSHNTYYVNFFVRVNCPTYIIKSFTISVSFLLKKAEMVNHGRLLKNKRPRILQIVDRRYQ